MKYKLRIKYKLQKETEFEETKDTKSQRKYRLGKKKLMREN